MKLDLLKREAKDTKGILKHTNGKQPDNVMAITRIDQKTVVYKTQQKKKQKSEQHEPNRKRDYLR